MRNFAVAGMKSDVVPVIARCGKLFRLLAVALILVAPASGCAGGGASAGVAANGLGASATVNSATGGRISAGPGALSSPAVPVPVTVRYLLPATKVAATAQNDGRRRLYISPSNTSISVTVTPVGGSGTTFGPTACTTGSCAISFTATPGATMLAFSLTNGGTVLSSFTTTQIVQPANENTFNLTANPVVASVNLALAAAPVPYGGTPVDVPLIVNAVDAGGNTIVGTQNYVDSSGKPFALSLSVVNVQAGGRGTVTIKGAPRITAPNQSAVFAHYDGNWLDHANIAVASTSAVVSPLTGTTLTTTPSAAELFSSDAGASDAVVGPDGNYWFSSDDQTVIKINPVSGGTDYNLGNPGAVVGIASGVDGNIWAGVDGGQEVIRISTGGAIVSTIGTGASTHQLIAGPDGNMWVALAGGSAIATLAPSGAIIAAYNVGYTAKTITAGTDGNLWYAASINQKAIGAVTPSGTKVCQVLAPKKFSGYGGAIVEGRDGNLWVSNSNGGQIYRVTHSCALTTYNVANMGGYYDSSMIVGPDGNLWYTTTDGIGRISYTGVTTDFPTGFGQSAGVIVLGTDGNIWFGEYDGTFGKFAY